SRTRSSCAPTDKQSARQLGLRVRDLAQAGASDAGELLDAAAELAVVEEDASIAVAHEQSPAARREGDMVEPQRRRRRSMNEIERLLRPSSLPPRLPDTRGQRPGGRQPASVGAEHEVVDRTGVEPQI